MCKGSHKIQNCNDYTKLSPAKRYEFIKSLQRCCNCLGNHLFTKCESKMLCSICNKKHHTTLHDENYALKFTKNFQDSDTANHDSNQFSNTVSLNSNQSSGQISSTDSIQSFDSAQAS